MYVVIWQGIMLLPRKKDLQLHRSLQNVSCIIVKIFVWNMRHMTKNKNCDCGHSKKEHMLTQKPLSALDVILFHDRVGTLQEGRGECRICHCSEYEPPKRLNPRWGMDYSIRSKRDDEREERCTRCGRLLENHKNVNHSFQYADRTPI